MRGRKGDGEKGRWGDGEKRRWEDGVMGIWGEGYGMKGPGQCLRVNSVTSVNSVVKRNLTNNHHILRDKASAASIPSMADDTMPPA